jgi:hypothetical protein
MVLQAQIVDRLSPDQKGRAELALKIVLNVLKIELIDLGFNSGRAKGPDFGSTGLEYC